MTVSETALTIVEGSSDSYTVALNTQPAGDVTVTVSGHAGTDASLDQTIADLQRSTTWSTAQEVTVTAGEDGDADGRDRTLPCPTRWPRPPMRPTTGSAAGSVTSC